MVMTWFCPGYDVGILVYDPLKYLSKHLLLEHPNLPEHATFLLSNSYFFWAVLLFLGCPTFFGLSYVIPSFFGASLLSYFFSPEKVLDTLPNPYIGNMHVPIAWTGSFKGCAPFLNSMFLLISNIAATFLGNYL